MPESVRALRQKAREAAEQWGADDRVASDISLAVSEAATNAVVHAYREREPGTLALVVESTDGEMHLEVIDNGSGLVPRADSPGMGLGLPVIARVSDRFEVCPGPQGRGTRLFMAFRAAA